MAEVTISPVLPFEEEQKSEGKTASLKNHGDEDGKRSIFETVQEATFKKVQMSHHGGVSNPDNIFGIISPKSKFSQRWDVLMIVLLLYTAIVTPFEVAYVAESVPELLIFLNRFVDICFFTDIIINFCLAYEMEDEGLWIVDHRMIASRYLKSWFLIDVVSTVPFDTLASTGATDDPSTTETLQQLKVLRVIRLFRLIKLARVLRASRIFKRWETKIAMSYAMQSLIKFVIIVIITTHWLACFLRLIVSLEINFDDKGNPLNYLTRNDLDKSTEWEQYLVGTYWALMTITTIGYGDVELYTDGEKGIGMFAMACGGFIYAYIVGAVCGIVATMDEATAKFQQRMDALQYYIKENRIPKSLKYRLREYFYHTRELQRAQHYNELLSLMTPTLRGEVAVLANGEWIRKVPFFNPKLKSGEELGDELFKFITEVTMKLTIESFAPNELVITAGGRGHQMYIIRKGVVGSHGRIMGSGNYFGEDMILQSAVRLHDVRCLTYLDVYVLTKDDLEDVLELGHFPRIYKSVRRSVMKYAFRRNIITYLSSITPEELRAAAGISNKRDKDNNRSAINYQSSDEESGTGTDSESDDDYGNTYGNSSTTGIAGMFPEGSSKGKKKVKFGIRSKEGIPEVLDGLEGDGGVAAARNGGSGGQILALANEPASSQSKNDVNALIQYHRQMGPATISTADDLMLNPQSLLPQLRCPICRTMCKSPVQSPTGHLFCKSCIIDALERSQKCPVTGEPLSMEDINAIESHNKILYKIWGSVQMRCQYHVHGCNWTGEQILVKNHEEKCTFKSWLSRCSFCNHSVPASDMEYHLKHQCKNYCCPKCVEREQIESSTSNAKLKTHTTLAILAKGYNYTQKSPVELTKMFVFHFRKKPENVNRERVFNILRACYSAWKKQEQEVDVVRMAIMTAIASGWFSKRQTEDMIGWMKFIAVTDGWLHDKHPGKDQFDCPYCNESGEWVGIRCGTCGQLWDLQDENAVLLR